MFSYRHIYHAGNFADVAKHVILTLLVDAMQRKDSPFCYLDTHAGIGRYDLNSLQAQQTGEFHHGVERIFNAAHPPEPVANYLIIVRQFNQGEQLLSYPGSPRFVRALLRNQDRMVLSELNPADNAALKREFSGDRQVAVHLKDAYQGLRAFLPPREKRALILIDPAYERKDEYQRLIEGITEAYARFPTGVYAIWYPIMSRSLVNRFYTDLQATGLRRLLRTEILIREESERTQMSGSGMIIINPPWQIDLQLADLLGWLANELQCEPGAKARVDWLTEE